MITSFFDPAVLEEESISILDQKICAIISNLLFLVPV